ncbi:hypothetical protein [Paenibacillus sp. 481]|uniref:hypothetical protein n=1 Tax=Paenibacillus sp. 481 TaxID=2835869 RepID=UPI001E5BE33E|nr:hypothetical protein [Paenibacillus sp. 481]UHA73284.1 hypothetical protein KIK04_22350 [Paenibacillus sp. 481]
MNINAASPRGNDRIFFGNEEVVILKTYDLFQLAKVKYNSSSSIFMVDISALQYQPDSSSSISISILGEVP